MKKSGWINLVFVCTLVFSFLIAPRVSETAYAQDSAGGPVYVVQQGDTMWDIAQRFGVTLVDLQNANSGLDPASLKAGDRLVIPGIEGIEGVLTTREVPYGENLLSLSRRYQVPASMMVRLNHLTSPSALYAGANLVIPEKEDSEKPAVRVSPAPGETLLELSVAQKANPWTIVAENILSGTWDVLPGDVLHIAGEAKEGPGALPGQVESVKLKPLPLVQGKTAVVEITAGEGISLTGSLAGHQLHFFPDQQGHYVALQGVHAMLSPGIYPVTLSGKLPDGTPFGFSQMVQVEGGDYVKDMPLEVPPETLDPAVTKPEDEEWFALASASTPEKLWQGVFEFPSHLFSKEYCLETMECFSSRFGSRRSYNGSDYIYFHTGLDIFGGNGVEIYAPAAGVVVFAGPMSVRGNVTMIDHGWGVYSAYMHQSEFKVQVGDRVESGQVIGLVGATGRAAGPHLHWEILVGDVQVQPLDWLMQEYP